MRLIAALQSIIAGKVPAPSAEPKPVRAVGQAARGYVDPKARAGTCRIVVSVDRRTFERIQRRAAEHEIKVAEEVRRLVAAGLNRRDASSSSKNSSCAA